MLNTYSLRRLPLRARCSIRCCSTLARILVLLFLVLLGGSHLPRRNGCAAARKSTVRRSRGLICGLRGGTRSVAASLSLFRGGGSGCRCRGRCERSRSSANVGRCGLALGHGRESGGGRGRSRCLYGGFWCGSFQSVLDQSLEALELRRQLLEPLVGLFLLRVHCLRDKIPQAPHLRCKCAAVPPNSPSTVLTASQVSCMHHRALSSSAPLT